MGELDSAAVVTAEPFQSSDAKKKVPSTPRVLTMKKVGGENECFQSEERFGGKTVLSIQKAKAAVQVCDDGNNLYCLTWETLFFCSLFLSFSLSLCVCVCVCSVL